MRSVVTDMPGRPSTAHPSSLHNQFSMICAWSYLKVCSLAAPADWDAILKDRKVAFTSVGKSPELIRAELINERLEQLERESLVKKVDLLFQLCTPPKDFAPINNYAYDRERLLAIDNASQRFVNATERANPIQIIRQIFDYFPKQPNFLLGPVNTKNAVNVNLTKSM